MKGCAINCIIIFFTMCFKCQMSAKFLEAECSKLCMVSWSVTELDTVLTYQPQDILSQWREVIDIYSTCLAFIYAKLPTKTRESKLRQKFKSEVKRGKRKKTKGCHLMATGYLVSASVFWILKFISCWSICLLRFSHSNRAFCRSLTTSPYPKKTSLVTSEHSPILVLKLTFQLFKLNTQSCYFL